MTMRDQDIGELEKKAYQYEWERTALPASPELCEILQILEALLDLHLEGDTGRALMAQHVVRNTNRRIKQSNS